MILKSVFNQGAKSQIAYRPYNRHNLSFESNSIGFPRL